MFVFDTNVLVAAFRSKQGASYTILSGIVEGTIPAMASVALLLEYEDVLSRDEQLEHFWQSADEIEKVMNVLAMRLQPVANYYSWRPVLSDPKDEHVLECAVNGGAEAIVTFNIKDFSTGVKQFDVRVITPTEFLKRYPS